MLCQSADLGQEVKKEDLTPFFFQKGTKRLIEKYGDRLVCVRYKYDAEKGKRYTTVELIEEESDWTAESPASPRQPSAQRLGVRVEYWENDLRERVKAAGGIWRPRQKVWELCYEDVVTLGIESRMVADTGSDART